MGLEDQDQLVSALAARQGLGPLVQQQLLPCERRRLGLGREGEQRKQLDLDHRVVIAVDQVAGVEMAMDHLVRHLMDLLLVEGDLTLGTLRPVVVMVVWCLTPFPRHLQQCHPF